MHRLPVPQPPPEPVSDRPVVKCGFTVEVNHVFTLWKLLYEMTTDGAIFFTYKLTDDAVNGAIATKPRDMDFGQLDTKRLDVCVEHRTATLIDWMKLRKQLINWFQARFTAAKKEEERDVLKKLIGHFEMEISKIKFQIQTRYANMKGWQRTYYRYVYREVDTWWFRREQVERDSELLSH